MNTPFLELIYILVIYSKVVYAGELLYGPPSELIIDTPLLYGSPATEIKKPGIMSYALSIFLIPIIVLIGLTIYLQKSKSRAKIKILVSIVIIVLTILICRFGNPFVLDKIL